MPIDDYDQIRKHAKEMGLENQLDDLIKNQKPREPIERPTKAEIKHRQKRKRKKKIVKASKRKNR